MTGKLVLDSRSREWCRLPYPDHPSGCPNYGKRSDCPPTACQIEEWIDLSRPHWFIIAFFDLGSHIQRMRSRHPSWSDRQCRCVLYWQSGVRKGLTLICRQFQKGKEGTVMTLTPEAMGVNVIETAERLGIPIERRPKRLVHKIALIGFPKKE